MRCLGLVLCCTVILSTCADPDPKKYKYEVKSKDKLSNASLTDEERKFLREVEAKFGIKSEVPVDTNNDDNDHKDDNKPVNVTKLKLPFPAVIAIEIVNDTDIDPKAKDKRTIDANLGYGYRTNNGYSYTYLGKSPQEKGKFMIYPYSQEDIPPARPSPQHNPHNPGHSQTQTVVEITPSQAYELVPEKEEENAYHYEKPAIKFESKPENIQSVESPPPPPHPTNHPLNPSTLYTTYNGEQFSSLTGQFPSVMSNYLVDSAQLLQSPQYQSAGLTEDHLQSHGAHLQQGVVPVLVLRIPSSYLKNPTAELYANLPPSYPLSQYLNNVKLQELVNQYFKKIGYSYAPQVMAYPSSLPVTTPPSLHEPQQYARPYVQPSYTHADYSGIHYSAVQPVMARYPAGYTSPHYYVTQSQSHYQQPLHQQYVYSYRYVPQSASQTYHQPEYQHVTYQLSPEQDQSQHTVLDQQSSVHNAGAHIEYESHQPSTGEEAHLTSVEVKTPQPETVHEYKHVSPTSSYEQVATATPQYEVPTEHSSVEHSGTKVLVPVYGPAPTQQVQYEQHVPHEQTETIAVYPRSQSGHRYSQPSVSQTYVYQNQNTHESDNHGLVLSENYPSKDHTIATVLPLSYKTRKQTPLPAQGVSYVTPIPHAIKYQSHYRVMVPHTMFKNPTREKVSYVNSYSLPGPYTSSGHSSRHHNSEEEHSAGPHYVPPISKQKPPLYPRNYHSHPKRMIKPESMAPLRKHNERKKLP